MAYTTINDPSAYFTTTLYTGNETARDITNDANAGDFKPDWVWIKVRNNANNHRLFDSSRGGNNDLVSNSNSAESGASGRLTTFNTNGFSLGTNAETNSNTHNIVAWQWKCNGGTTTDVSASGSGATQIVASTHQANTEAGFSIVTFTAPSIGSGNDFTVSHGLGAVPEVIILKRRNGTSNWHVYHKGTGNLGATFLNLTNAFADAEYFGDTDPTSTVFSQSEGSATDPGHTLIAYCFRSIQGYSKIGTYYGNGSDNGTVVYTGFKPAFTLIKRIAGGAGAWELHDSARAGFINPTDNYVYANQTNVEAEDTDFDYLANGFKIRQSYDSNNRVSTKYIYLAFADHPFVSSTGTPTTAR